MQTGAPQTAGERLSDDIYNLNEKTKARWITDCADRRGQTKSRLAAPRQLSEKRIHSKRQESRGLGKVVLALLRPPSIFI